MSSIKQATELVKSAMEALDGELYRSPDPKLASVSKVQKEAFKQKLQKIYDTLNSGSLPEKSLRNMGLSHAIADSWPFDSKLAEEIAKAERAFIEAK
ncbi:hypothetical protein [Vibrio cincinnatiensis]|uniref:hypothetical protein n=1 Tax=Vibrio cincinnatiensis TaxID=675 RepID=UPI001EDCC031|nr:hypothetical protein [Vibrio cincinnatiensis]MCG3724110.1 hypothetical protein [Vibrio cincinnatiensis]